MTRVSILGIRIWADTVNGAQYSIIHRDGCITPIPIPEHRRLREKPCFLDPDCTKTRCTNKPLSHYMQKPYPLHNDPRLDQGFYTGYWAPRGVIPRDFKPTGILLFFAGLAAEHHSKRPRLKSLVAEQLGGVYLVGGILVEEVIDTSKTGWRRALKQHPELICSPHYWRRDVDMPLAVLGRGFALDPPIPAHSPETPERPSQLLTRLLGEKAAQGFALNNYRRTRLVRGREEEVMGILGSMARLEWSPKLLVYREPGPCTLEAYA